MELLGMALLAPIALGLILIGLGHDLTDPAFGEALEKERENNA